MGSLEDSATNASKSSASSGEPATEIRCRTESGIGVGSVAPCCISTLGSVSARTARIPSAASRWFTGASAAPSSPEANSDSRNAGSPPTKAT